MKLKSLSTIRNEKVKDLEHLTLTRHIISEEKFVHDAWLWMKNQYLEINENDGVSRGMTSILNAILNQERIYFAITRKGTLDLVKGDKNYQKKDMAFRNGSYSNILATLQEAGFIRKFQDSSNDFSATGYEVVDELFLTYLDRKIDRELQKRQVIDFCTNYTSGTRTGTKGIKVIRNKGNKESRNEDSSIVDVDSKVAGVADVANAQLSVELMVNVDANESENLPSNPNISHTEEILPKNSAKKVSFNSSHQELLNKALSINPSLLNDFEKQFLIGKQEALTKYGSFKEKQINILKRIASKTAFKAPIPKGLLRGLLQREASPEAISDVLKGYSLTTAQKQQLPDILKEYLDEEDSLDVIRLMNLK